MHIDISCYCGVALKVEELVKMSGGRLDNQLKDQFADITKTILANQTEALGNLTKKVCGSYDNL